MNGRVRIFRYIILKLRIRDNHLRQQGFHKIIRQIFFCCLIRRLCHIVPCIIIVHLLVQARKSVFRHHRHIEFQRIKHQIRTFFMQCGIVDIGNQSDDTIRLSPDRYGISHRNADIVRMHAVHRNLIGRCREASLHQACQIDIICLLIDADGSVRDAVAVVILLLIAVEILGYVHRNRRKITVIQFVFVFRLLIFFVNFVQNLVPGFIVRLFIRLVMCLPIRLVIGGIVSFLIRAFVCGIVGLLITSRLLCLRHRRI